MYYVIYSTDPYLLARMATNLQLEGHQIDDWEETFDPFYTELPPRKWLVYHLKDWSFHNHDASHLNPSTRFTLTEKNYIEVLGAIIKNKDK